MTYVYKHTFPNGKIYIGIADNYLNRWNNGKGYSDNPPMYEAIKQYGWDNIKHEILKECDTRQEAEQLEQRFILAYHSENNEIGYNRTKFTKSLLNITPILVENEVIKTKKYYTKQYYTKSDNNKNRNENYVIKFENVSGVTSNERLAKWFIEQGYQVEVFE